jgi:hypothetical protein
MMTQLTILEFIGGCWDGMNLCNESPDPAEAALASDVYRLTAQGRQGQKTVMPPGYAVGKPGVCGHLYVVTDRTATREEVLVRLECVAEREADHCLLQEGAGPAVKRIVFEFEGGYLDRVTLDSLSPDVGEALLATAYYCITDGGALGKRFGETPPTWRSKARTARFSKDHEYRIVRRAERRNKVVLTCSYFPKTPSGAGGKRCENGRATGEPCGRD